MSIDALVFSRDRPMQLDACLRSLYEHVELDDVAVIYQATQPHFEQGYMIVADESPAWMVRQTEFSEDVLAVLPQLGPFVLFQCDDAITFRDAPDAESAFTDDVISLCLRLGSNTRYCHPRDLHHGLPDFERRGPFQVWDWHGDTPDGDLFDWQGREGDFGYPYSIDGNVHRRDSVREWVGGGQFVNPNQMEGCVVHAIGQRRDLPPLMASYPHSVQVGLPINVVNQTHGNRFGLVYPVETLELNERFLNGERVDLDAMDYEGVIGAHQELELRFAT